MDMLDVFLTDFGKSRGKKSSNLAQTMVSVCQLRKSTIIVLRRYLAMRSV